MMLLYYIFGLTLLAATLSLFSVAQVSNGSVSEPSEVSFQFEKPGAAVPRFELTVREDGSGTYKAELAPVPRGGVAGDQIDRAITLSQPTVDEIFKAARAASRFNIECDSKSKDIADTGRKTLSYAGADGHGSCTYNYSGNKSVEVLTDTFQAIAFTMDEGRKLDYLHRYDRLGLYGEMDTLVQEYKEKRALELGTISSTLDALARDEAVMQSVRTRAAMLLKQVDDTKSTHAR